MAEHIKVTRDNGRLDVVLARPERRNAITIAMYAAMAEAVETANAEGSDVRLITLSGEGVDFTAGNDLMDFMQEMPQPGSHEDIPVWRFLRAMATNRVPVLAKVHGNAIGIGTTMLFHCDLVIAAEDTRFKMPFTELGLVPEAASSLILPELAGRRAAARYLLLGESFGAAEAKAIGLLSHVAQHDELDEKFEGIAATLLSRPPEAMRQTQGLLRKVDSDRVLERMTLENGKFAERLASDELKGAIAAFFAARGGAGG
ncbi:enoyl-CoA hydratase-related protein [Sphingomicrobium aestuariivivum]|uniref:enoyl-CoA hydratase-related protein n=1 Tax=Sphingomicrobium aestuariivivum TaxID=1582356 RepID=UPI001FD650A7|nr:enoyl-CoA hydratase-related protein [Sphingomicrobium aestuariivivum]MCJ8190266.1 enoyl-CoA hydratase-related protein [Sphingomicrobium aestuariivivum]